METTEEPATHPSAPHGASPRPPRDDIQDRHPTNAQSRHKESPDPVGVEAFAERLLGDMASTSTTLMTIVGDRLGLYDALSGAGPVRAEQLAQASGLNPRLVTEWLAAQTVAGYVVYDPDASTYELPVEHAAVLSDPDSPAYIVAGATIVGGLFQALDHLERAFRGDGGIEIYDALNEDARFAVERFFKTSYTHELAASWFGAVNGLTERLEQGVRVADVGSGHGPSTIAMATTWPRLTVTGFEPWSLDRLEDGIGDPRTRMDYGISTAMCTPGSLAQPGAYGLGTQGGPTRRLELMAEAGFREPAVVADTGLNLVLAARR